MSSQDHLDASSGREVVFCHACHDEWYRDAHPTLQCPYCDSEITEIIEPGNDPRTVDSLSDLDSNFPGHGRDYGHDDSDPGEEDIEDHLPSGRDRYSVHHRIFPPPRSGADRGRPDDDMAVFQRFTDMLMNDFRLATPERPHGTLEDGQREGTGTRIHRATFTTGPGGFRGGSVTIGFGPAIRRVGPSDARGPPDFDGIFGSLMNNVPPPRDDGSQQGQGTARGGNAQGGQGLPPPFFATLQDLLTTLLNPGAAVHGDAVYTQEALDRIITQLMEANPQSNAAPPASTEALANLEKKPLDEKMIGSDEKVECTICIDEVSKGEDVTVLPCKHFFHPECVTMWLKEHNTCPICRTPIEQRDENNAQNNNSNNNGNPNVPGNPGLSTGNLNSPEGRQERRPWGPFAVPFRSEVLWDSRTGPDPSAQSPRNTRSAQQNEDRLNAIRNLRDLGSSSRRSSHSPPSRETGPASAIRVRSPSSSRDRDHGRDSERDHDSGSPLEAPRDTVRQHWSQHWSSQRPSNESRQNSSSSRSDHGPPDGNSGSGGGSSHGNPLNWIRDRLSRDRGSGAGSENGRRRS
ncbi:hypothetical protein GQ53DRAFT_825221 [Thozetella sp. PMI_491]|nr:hypothetical protein GQ53DRAFT_825221 [Thozetella sp. PMI_491]